MVLQAELAELGDVSMMKSLAVDTPYMIRKLGSKVHVSRLAPSRQCVCINSTADGQNPAPMGMAKTM